MKSKFIKSVAITMSAALIMGGMGAFGTSAAVIDDDISVAADDTSTDSSTTLPSSYSSVDLGYVTSIKSQQYNDCWAYAAVATLESKLLRSGFQFEDISEAHLNAWATTFSNGTGWIRNYTNGGYSQIGLGYLTSWQGGVYESDVQDLDITTIQYGDEVDTTLARYGVTAIRYLSSDDTTEIKQAIIDNGGVFSSYSHSATCYSNNKQAYYMPSTYSGTYSGHAIEIVGWDDDYSTTKFKKVNGNQPTNNGAWLVKNSWGENNSIGGYFWMSYENRDIFTTKYYPSYTIESVEEIDDSQKLIQNEVFGATYEFSYINTTNITYLNRFDFEDGYDTLDKVIFETTTKNAEYTLYYVPTINDTPTTSKSKWVYLGDGTVDYSGYICVDIDDFTIPDSNGSIAVSFDSSEVKTASTIGVSEWLVKSGSSDYIFLNNSEYNQSYIYNNHTMTDVMDWYKTNNDDEVGGTFVIKALTTKSSSYALGDVNLDGIISINDATLIQKYLIKVAQLTDEQLSLADVDKNGIIDIRDATRIQKYLVGLIDEL